MNTSTLPVVILFLTACIILYLFIRIAGRNVCVFIPSTLKEQKKLHCIVSTFFCTLKHLVFCPFLMARLNLHVKSIAGTNDVLKCLIRALKT